MQCTLIALLPPLTLIVFLQRRAIRDYRDALRQIGAPEVELPTWRLLPLISYWVGKPGPQGPRGLRADPAYRSVFWGGHFFAVFLLAVLTTLLC